MSHVLWYDFDHLCRGNSFPRRCCSRHMATSMPEPKNPIIYASLNRTSAIAKKEMRKLTPLKILGFHHWKSFPSSAPLIGEPIRLPNAVTAKAIPMRALGRSVSTLERGIVENTYPISSGLSDKIASNAPFRPISDRRLVLSFDKEEKLKRGKDVQDPAKNPKKIPITTTLATVLTESIAIVTAAQHVAEKVIMTGAPR